METRKWTSSEDAILTIYITKHGARRWNLVQKYIGINRNGKSCRLRWKNHLSPNLKKGALTAEEGFVILNLHAQLGNKWAQIAKQLPGRTDNTLKNYVNNLTRKAVQARVKASRHMSTFNMHHSLPQLDEGGETTFDFSEGSHSDATAGTANLHYMPLDIITDVHGSGDSDVMMNNCLLWNTTQELSHDLEYVSTPNMAIGQPQHISSLTEDVCRMNRSAVGICTYVNDSFDCVHGNEDHDMSINHVSSNDERPSTNESSVTSLITPWPDSNCRGMTQNGNANPYDIHDIEMRLVQSEWYNTPSQRQLSPLATENSEPQSLAVDEIFPCYLDPENLYQFEIIPGYSDAAGKISGVIQPPCYVDPSLDYGTPGTPPGAMPNTVYNSAIPSQIQIPSWNWNLDD